jgi:transposase
MPPGAAPEDVADAAVAVGQRFTMVPARIRRIDHNLARRGVDWSFPELAALDPGRSDSRLTGSGARGSIRRLFREIQALGYDGSYPVVRDYLARNGPAREPLPPAPPVVRDVTNWLCRRPDTLTEDEKSRLKAILGRCPELQAASGQVRAFAAMITGLTGENLPQWIDTARTAALPGTGSFAKGLEQDLDAVTNGLTMPWSSGPVEGRVNYIKMIKRRMFGRAGLPCSANESCSPRRASAVTANVCLAGENLVETERHAERLCR